MATANFDELNNIENQPKRSIPYDKFFGEMDLTEEEKEKRIGLAKELEALFYFIFALALANNFEDITELYARAYGKYTELSNKFLGVKKTPAYMDEYIDTITRDIVDATIRNIDDAYYTSLDRAMFIAENEANSVGNYGTHVEAVKQGKKYKTWVTMKDKRVRHTHVEVDNKKIGIFDEFQVGKAKMLYPRENYNYPEECVNCRCQIKYS